MADEATLEAPTAAPQPMDTEAVRLRMHHLVTHARQFIEDELSDPRAKATDYYNAKPFGNEEEGRSQYIDTSVRDTIQAMMPSLMRVFFGSERAVELVSKRAEGAAGAEQATETIQHIFSNENNGFLQTHSALQDGLTRKLGVFTWGYEATPHREQHTFDAATPEQLALLAAEEGVAITEQRPRPDGMVDVTYDRVESDGRIRIYAVPGEEFIFTREARGPDDALLVAHMTEKSRSALLEMGVSAEDLDAHGAPGSELNDTSEEIARREANQEPGGAGDDPEAGPENAKILYVRAFTPMDVDGDGIAELREICTIGPTYHPVKNERAEDVPFSVFSPRPEAHTMVGQSIADATMDMQRTKSMVVRSMLDSLALAIHPRTAYVEGQVSAADVMSTVIGDPIRMRTMGAVQEFTHTFVGKEAFPVLGYFDDVIERRTGQNKGAAGLDADALQSTTKGAVDAAVSSSQAQVELLARIFAETAMKPMFRGVYKLLVQHQPRKRVMRLRGQYVEVDPRTWDADMDVEVRVALGAGFTEQRIQSLMAIKETQEGILQMLGPQNPIVTLGQYSHTLRVLTELVGHRDAKQFFNELPPDWQPPPTPPQPSPEEQLVQLEQQKAQIQMQQKQAEMQMKERELVVKQQMQAQELTFKSELEQRRLEHQMALETRKLDMEMALKEREMEMKLHLQREQAAAQATLQREQTAHAEHRADATAAADTDRKDAESQRSE